MSAYLNDFLKSGKKILEDTKSPAIKKEKAKPVAALGTPTDSDPHKVFIKRMIQERPKKKDVVEEFEKFIKAAEAL